MNSHPQKILLLLEDNYDYSKSFLNFKTPFQLLVATILSAQSTDAQINKITPALFRKYRNVKDFASASQKELERLIFSSGFYHNKAKNIINCANTLLSGFNGVVPKTIEELTALPGVGRKTANIVLTNAFNIVEGIAVDTHVARLSKRLGFSKSTSPEKIELDLMSMFLKKDWHKLNHLLISHGRAVCNAKAPKCGACFLSKYCPSRSKFS